MGKKEDFTQIAFRVAQQATRQAPTEEPKALSSRRPPQGAKAASRAVKLAPRR
jgi:hypothetical protein